MKHLYLQAKTMKKMAKDPSVTPRIMLAVYYALLSFFTVVLLLLPSKERP